MPDSVIALALCLTWSPDGTLMASGHVDGNVRLRDARAGVELRVKLRHEGIVPTLAFSPAGRCLATGSLDSTLKVWDLAAARNGEARREMHREPAGVKSLCYTADGGSIVTAHGNRVLRLQDAATGRLTATLRGPEANSNLMVLHPDGKRLAVASHDRTLRLFDLASRAQVQVLQPPLSPAGPLITIRCPLRTTVSADGLVTEGALSIDMLSLLRSAVRARLNVLVAGATGSGVSTMLSALASLCQDHERIVTLQDAPTLAIAHPYKE